LYDAFKTQAVKGFGRGGNPDSSGFVPVEKVLRICVNQRQSAGKAKSKGESRKQKAEILNARNRWNPWFNVFGGGLAALGLWRILAAVSSGCMARVFWAARQCRPTVLF
jgi:hypothetical protein